MKLRWCYVFALVCAGLSVLFSVGCDDQKSLTKSVSPSGNFRYLYFDADIPGNAYGNVVAIVQNRTGGSNGRVLYVAPVMLREQDNNVVTWGSGDILWINSGDTGLWYCRKDRADRWQVFSYEKRESPTPPDVPGIDPNF